MKGKWKMLVLAISTKGHEFFYDARTAHKVSKAAAEKIRDVCNEYKFRLKEGETWFLHDFDFMQSSKIPMWMLLIPT